MMKLPIFLICWLMLMSFVAAEDKIQDGTSASLGQFPFVVYVSIPLGKNWIEQCSGFIIGKSWVIIASHCTQGTTASSSNPITINAGVLNGDNTTGQLISVAQWFDHPRYKQYKHDITLLQLSTPLTWNSNVQPIVMSWEAGIIEKAGMSTTFVGYGTDQFRSNVSDLEYTANTNTIDSSCSNCGMICVTSTTSSTVCQGDSGGPLLYKDSTKGWIALGTLSNGGACNGTAGIQNEYTSLNQYKEFITCILSGSSSAKCDCSCGGECGSTKSSETQSAVFSVFPSAVVSSVAKSSGVSQTKSMSINDVNAVYQTIRNCTFSRKLKKMCIGAGGEFSCETTSSTGRILPRGLMKCNPTTGTSFSSTFSVRIKPNNCAGRLKFYSSWCSALGGSGGCASQTRFVCQK